VALNRQGRLPGSKNLKTLEGLRDEHAYRFQTVLFQRMHTPTNIEKFRKTIDRCHTDAANGDARARSDLLRLHEMADRESMNVMARMVLLDDLDTGGCSMDGVVAWVERTLPVFVGTDAQGTFLELAESLFRMAAGRERERDAVPLAAVQALVSAFVGTMREIISAPEEVLRFRESFQSRVEGMPILRMIAGGADDAGIEAGAG
jgi:hypothetical protein